MSIPYKAFYFMRHGETIWNLENKLMGQIDIHLNNKGFHQAQLAGARIKNLPFDNIICSPLSRTTKTAEIIANITHKPIITLENLRGCNWGDLAGKKLSTAWYQSWVSNTLEKGYRGESYQAFKERIIKGLKQALETPGIPLILGHGGGYSIIQKELNISAIQYITHCRTIFHQPPAQEHLGWASKLVD
jgi:broad specificity phosphatase PhoE